MTSKQGEWQTSGHAHRVAVEEVSSPMRHRFSTLSTVFAGRCLSEHERFIQLMDATITTGTPHTTTRSSGKLRGLVKLCEERIQVVEEFIQEHVRMYGDFDQERIRLFMKTIDNLKRARSRALGMNLESEYHPERMQDNLIPHLAAHKAGSLKDKFEGGEGSPQRLDAASPGPRTIRPHPASRGTLTSASPNPGSPGSKVRGFLGVTSPTSVRSASARTFDVTDNVVDERTERSASAGVPNTTKSSKSPRGQSTPRGALSSGAFDYEPGQKKEEKGKQDAAREAEMDVLRQHVAERFRLSFKMVQLEEEKKRKTIKEDCIGILRSWYSLHKDMKTMLQEKDTRKQLTSHALALSQERLNGQTGPLNPSGTQEKLAVNGAESKPPVAGTSVRRRENATTAGGAARSSSPTREISATKAIRIWPPAQRDARLPRLVGDLDALHFILLFLGIILGTLFGAILLPIIVREYSSKAVI